MSQSTAIIMNPIAGPPRGRLSVDEAKDLFRKSSLDVEILISNFAGEVSEIASKAAMKHPIVAVVGGDGSVSELANGLFETDAKMGILPNGSGNDFANGIGLNSVSDGVKAIIKGDVIKVDLAQFAGRKFINSCGLFLSGLTSLKAASVPRQFGKFRYLMASAFSIFSHNAVKAEWVFDSGESFLGHWALAEIGNGPYCGGGFQLTPKADMTDGLLDFCILKSMPKIGLINLLPKGIDGSHLDREEVRYPRCEGATINIEATFAAHWDGEAAELPAGSYRFEVTKGALEIMAPRRST